MVWRISRGRTVRGSVLLLCALVGLCSLGSRRAGADTDKFHVNIGFSSRAFINVPQEDIKIAIRILAQKIARNTVGSANAAIYDSIADIERDLKARKLDAVALTPDDFLQLRKRMTLDPAMVTATDTGHEVDLVLLARRESRIRGMGDLRNKRFAIPMKVSQFGSMYLTWVEMLLMGEGVAPNDRYFAVVTETRTPAQAIMQVFFRKADACATFRQLFELTTELNPQIGRELQIIKQLPKLAGGIIVFRNDLAEERKQKLRHTLTTIHEGPEGKQLFTLFQLKKLIPYRAEYLRGTEEFYHDYRVLARRFNHTR